MLFYSIFATILEVALISNGYPVPDIFKQTLVDPNVIIQTVNSYAGQPIIGGGSIIYGMVGIALANAIMSMVKGFYAFVVTLASMIDPTFVPVAMFVGALGQASIYLYMLMTLSGG